MLGQGFSCVVNKYCHFVPGAKKYASEDDCCRGVRSENFVANCGPNVQENVMSVEEYNAMFAMLSSNATDPLAEELDTAGTSLPGQMPGAGGTVPGQMVPGQMMPGQAMPGQVMPGQMMPGQMMPGQMPGQMGMPGQMAPGAGVIPGAGIGAPAVGTMPAAASAAVVGR